MVNMAGIAMAPELLPAAGQSGRYQGIGRNTGAARLFIAFWQDSTRDNPIEIARVSVVPLFTQHNIRYVEYISKCLYYAELYPPFPPGVCRTDPHPPRRPRRAASYCSEKFLAFPNHFGLGGVI